jgi:hypothetical protein
MSVLSLLIVYEPTRGRDGGVRQELAPRDAVRATVRH